MILEIPNMKMHEKKMALKPCNVEKKDPGIDDFENDKKRKKR